MSGDLRQWAKGDRIGNFTVQRYLGEGWEAVVLLVRDRHDAKLRTLKLFKRTHVTDEVRHTVQHWQQRYAGVEQIKKFLEWGLLAGQRRVSERPWMLFEYIPGMTLAEKIERGHIREPTAMAIKLLEALVPIHARSASVGDMDKGRNLVVERGTGRYVFVDADAGGPQEPPPGLKEDIDEVVALARRAWRRQGQRPDSKFLEHLAGSTDAVEALERLHSAATTSAGTRPIPRPSPSSADSRRDRPSTTTPRFRHAHRSKPQAP